MQRLTRILEDEADTERLGADIAMALKAGDIIALKGELGAGKTTLARGAIRQLAGEAALDVPSPSYTLCQHYEFGFPLSHFDLYRIGDESEIDELGLEEAVDRGVVMVEWPEHAGDRLRGVTLMVELAMPSQGGRVATITGGDGKPSCLERVARSLAIRDFLDTHWGKTVRRRFLQGDASTRRYETAMLGDEVRILMDSPRQPDGPPVASPLGGDPKPYSQIAHLAEDVVPFIAIDEILRENGFGAPAIFASSIRKGLLLGEHLGHEGLVGPDGTPIGERYGEAARLLARLHGADWPRHFAGKDGDGEDYDHVLPAYDEPAWLIEVSLMADWYVPGQTGNPLSDDRRERFFSIWHELARRIARARQTLVLRDYHSPNLIWREHLPFPANLGLIDFQDALFGPAAYDLASLGQDARVDIAEALEKTVIDAYLVERDKLAAEEDFDGETFLEEYAIVAAQRATKILGIFVRLNRRDGKPGYLRHLPRLRAYLKRNLAHPVLAPYREWCAETGVVTAAD